MNPEEKRYEETPRTDIKATIGEAGTTVKESALSSLKGVNEIETLIVTLVRNTVSGTLKATGSMADETVNVTRSVLQGTFKAAGSLGNTAVKAVMNVLVSAVECVKEIASTALADVAPSLRQVLSTPPELQKAETAGIDIHSTQPASGATQEGPPEEKPALTPENSIQDDKVICLECGAEMIQLTVKHLVSHGMNQKEYRQKYGFSMKTPLAAKSLIEARSQAAKEQGLSEKRKHYLETRRQAKAEATTQAATEIVTASKPKRTRIRKKKA